MHTSTATSTLIAPRAHYVTRADLANLPTPVSTATFRAVPHHELVTALADQFAAQDVTVTHEQLAINRTGTLLFGTFDLSMPGPDGDFNAAFGFRAGNDKSLAIRAVAGLRVLVCSNLALSGDQMVLRRRHTSGLRIADEAANAVRRFADRYQHLVGEVQSMKTRTITDDDAKRILYDVFSRRILPPRLLPAAHEQWFEPKHDEFARSANLWRLHNGLTEVAKELAPGPQMTGLSKIGRLFSNLLN